MTRKKFVGKMNHFYAEAIRVAKANGQDSEKIRRCALIRAKDYKLPAGATYQQVWDGLVRVCGDIYDIK